MDPSFGKVPDAPRERSTRILFDSYVLVIGKNPETGWELSESRDLLPELHLITPVTRQMVLWNEIESEDYHLLLDGTLYLNSTNHLAPEKNLEVFLSFLTEQSLEAAQREITGGVFNLFILDHKAGRLWILNDLWGINPLYVLQKEDQILLTSHQSNLLGRSALNQTAVFEFLKYGYLPISASFFEDVGRLGPSTQAQVHLEGLRLETHAQPLPAYAEQPRDGELDDQAIYIWSRAWLESCKRIQSHKTLLELSGDYPSRLLAAQIHHLDPLLINYGDHFSSGTSAARQIGKALEMLVRYDKIGADAPAEFARDLASGFRIPQSLEQVHLLQLSRQVEKEGMEFCLDGALGGAVLGDDYFQRLEPGFRRLWKMVQGNLDPEDGIGDSLDLDRAFEAGPVLTDHQVSEYLGIKHEKLFLEMRKAWMEENRSGCPTPLDLLERLRMLSFGRNVEAGRMLAVQMRTPLILPFLDRKLQERWMATPKRERAYYRLFKHYLQQYFPAVADVPMPGTSARATDADLLFRLKAGLGGDSRSLGLHFLGTSGGPQKKHPDVVEYLQNETTSDWLRKTFRRASRFMPYHIHRKVKSEFEVGELPPLIQLRYASLLLYLQAGDGP